MIYEMAEIVLQVDDVKYPKHYSYTRINMYIRCPFQEMFRYKYGLKMKPSSALTFGSSTHETIEDNFKHKIETKKDLKVSDVKNLWEQHWVNNLKKNPDIVFEEGENKNTILDEGITVISEYQKLVAPTIIPQTVEEPFSIHIDGVDTEIQGRIDLIDINNVIVDHKTGKKNNETQEKIDSDLQMSMYALAYLEIYRTLPKGLEKHYLIRTKKPQFPQFSTKRTEENLEAFKNTVRNVIRGIENEIYYPNTNHMLCSEKYCGYYSLCGKGTKIIWASQQI